MTTDALHDAAPTPPGPLNADGTDRPTSPPGRMSWGPLLVVLAGTFMTILDFFIVNVAIPSLQTDLAAGRPAVQFVVAGYGLTFAVGLITGGRLGDLYGRRRMFVTGLVLFTLASAACALAPSVAPLIAARLAQGMGAALLTPQVLAIIGTLYVGAHRARAFAIYGMVLGLAGVFGQLIGGALIQADPAGLGWRAIFLINVPFGLVAIALTRRLVPESHPEAGVRLDLIGTAVVSAALAALVLPLAEGRELGWPTWTWLSLAAAVLLFVAFVAYQRRCAAVGGVPLVHPALFAERAFTPGLAVTLVFLMANGSFFFVLALYLQQGRGFSALESGLLFAAVGVGFFGGLVPATALAARLGRQVLTLGALTATAGFLALAQTSRTIGISGGVVWLVLGLSITGLGLGLVLAPLTATVLGGVSTRHAGAAAGVLSTAQELGGALGVTVIGVVFYNALGDGGSELFPHAFTTATLTCAGLAMLAAGLVQFLPRPTVVTD